MKGDFLTDFKDDVTKILTLLEISMPEELRPKLSGLANRLNELRDRNMLKVNHSILELVVAKYLLLGGYEVELEREIGENLACDVWASKGLGTLIVEVETGYVPPSHALDPGNYVRARVASKIARYSSYCNKFSLGTPPHYILPIPECFIKPPRFRTSEEIEEIKRYCDMYYSNPPVTMDEILNSRIHSVFIIDVDGASVKETDPVDYVNKSKQWYM
ncbi:MAG: hypothetical protein QXN93_06975 [Methanomassiliicoccales archaeon]